MTTTTTTMMRRERTKSAQHVYVAVFTFCDATSETTPLVDANIAGAKRTRNEWKSQFALNDNYDTHSLSLFSRARQRGQPTTSSYPSTARQPARYADRVDARAPLNA